MHAKRHQMEPASQPGRLPKISSGAHTLSQSRICRARHEAQVRYTKENTQMGLNWDASWAFSTFSNAAIVPTNKLDGHGWPCSMAFKRLTSLWQRGRGIESKSTLLTPSGPVAVCTFLCRTVFSHWSTVIGSKTIGVVGVGNKCSHDCTNESHLSSEIEACLFHFGAQ